MLTTLENSAVTTGLENVSFHSNPKERQCQRMLRLWTIILSHASKVMLKILQARLQQYMNQELPDVQAGFRKGRGTRDQRLFSSVQFSRSVMSDSSWPHESQHARPPCPSPTPGVHSDSRPSSQWCHPAISSSVVPFSSCPQSLPASASFPMSQLFAWGSQGTGVSALASFPPKKS